MESEEEGEGDEDQQRNLSFITDDDVQDTPTFYTMYNWREMREEDLDLDEEGEGIVYEEDSNTREFIHKLESKNLSVKVLHVKLYPVLDDTCKVLSLLKGEATVCLRTTNAKKMLSKVMEEVYERGDENEAKTIQREVKKAREGVWLRDDISMNENISYWIGLGVETIYYQCKLGPKDKRTSTVQTSCKL